MVTRFFVVVLALFVAACAAPAASAEPLRPKVVIVGYFETSKAHGVTGYWGEADRPGELYFWIEHEQLTRRVPIRGAFTPGWTNADGSILAVKIGPNSLHPAVNLTALGLDPAFDLRRSYWLINGIAGTSPVTGTIGDLVWTNFVVNGDVAHEIDAREIPADWPTGYFPAGRTAPYPQPRVKAGSPDDIRTWPAAFHQNRSRTITQLNPGLLRWAIGLTEALTVVDAPEMQRVRDEYHFDPARARPRVGVGATLSAETFWLGARMDAWAREWTAYMTDGLAAFRTTETNDAGAMVALAALADAGCVDANRVLLLRGASNFDMPPEGVPADQQLIREGPQAFAGYLPTLQSLHQVGSVVVHELTEHWERYADKPPGAAK